MPERLQKKDIKSIVHRFSPSCFIIWQIGVGNQKNWYNYFQTKGRKAYEYTCDLEHSDKTLVFEQSKENFRLGIGMISSGTGFLQLVLLQGLCYVISVKQTGEKHSKNAANGAAFDT